MSTQRRLSLAVLFLSLAVGVLRATSVIPPNFDELVNQSDYIVRAVVKSVVAEQRAQPDGSTTIFSHVTLEVKEVIAGTPPSPLVLEVLGGRIGDRELRIEGAPRFAVGAESVLFVQGNGRQIYPVVRIMHGVYPIQRDAGGREYVARSNGAPLLNVNDVSLPAEGAASAASSPLAARALSPAEFSAQIRAAAHEPRLLERHTQ